MKHKLLLTSALVIAAGTASAETMATATTDLNVRSGPGPWYDVVGTIPASEQATVESCYTEANWCKISFGDTKGWSYGEYLVVGDETPVSIVAPDIVENPETDTVTRLEVDDQSSTAAAVGFGWGALAGGLIAGPPGAALGAVAVAGLADSQVGPEITAYIDENPVEPVYLNGELVVGAGIPDSVEIYEYPDNTDWAYLNVNGQPIVIETDTRKIVEIIQ